MAAIRKYIQELMRIASERNFWLKPLGYLDGYVMWLVRTRQIYSFEHVDPKVLIVSGFHGEEQAGPWGILKWMKEAPDSYLEKFDVSFIPIVNSYGFAKGKRYGLSNMQTNTGFGPNGKNDTPSPEGEILIKHMDIIRPLAQDGCLSLHEDITVREYYLYTSEHGPRPGLFTYRLKQEMKKYFPKAYDGVAYVDTKTMEEGPKCTNGIVYNYFDGSFEDWMFQLGVPKVVATETPGKYQLKRRVAANTAMISKFLELVK
jgi:hypothetical protein